MTHSITIEDRVNSGSFRTVFLTVDVTSLENAGGEPIDLEDEVGLNRAIGAGIIGMESADSYLATWDHINDEIHFADSDTGGDVSSGTDVGEVRLRVDGDPSA